MHGISSFILSLNEVVISSHSRKEKFLRSGCETTAAWSERLSVYLSICLFAVQFVCLSVCSPCMFFSICGSVSVFLSLSVCQSAS